jgi:hypothetical protein
MQPKLWLLLIAVVSIFDAGSAFAHHAFANTYLVDREIAIEGRVVGVVYRNPHSYIHLMAPDGTKHLRVWAVECSNRGQLSQQGGLAETLKPGDHLVVTGSPGRDADTWRLRMRRIVRPSDGWQWSATSR